MALSQGAGHRKYSIQQWADSSALGTPAGRRNSCIFGSHPANPGLGPSSLKLQVSLSLFLFFSHEPASSSSRSHENFLSLHFLRDNFPCREFELREGLDLVITSHHSVFLHPLLLPLVKQGHSGLYQAACEAQAFHSLWLEVSQPGNRLSSIIKHILSSWVLGPKSSITQSTRIEFKM